LHPEKQIGYVGQGDCHRSSEDYEGAIHCYNIALKIEPTPSVLLRKAICLLELQNYDLALIDINNILDSDP
jgi:tetratricopeptide (TPR) repeat protein